MFLYLTLGMAFSSFPKTLGFVPNSDVNHQQNSRHVPGCGYRPSSARVVNGNNAKPHSWSWQISLRSNRGTPFCGGSLIHPQWVVTASHCVEMNKNPKAYIVVAGAHDFMSSNSYIQTKRVSQIYMHEKYYKLNHDIALLKLDSPVRTSTQVNSICLPRQGSRAPTGSRCYITGWGRLSGSGWSALKLQQAMLPVADNAKCKKRNSVMLPVYPNNMICAGAQGKGGCKGDSGGPFVCQEGRRWVLRGVTSWGHPRCLTNYYTVFARVSSYINWIKNKMGGGSGGGSVGGICLDRDIRCPDLAHRCHISSYVQKNCKRTCRLCQPIPHK